MGDLVRKCQAKQLIQLTDERVAAHDQPLVIGLHDSGALLIELVLDLAKQLLDQVLARHHATGSAVFIEHNGQVTVSLVQAVPDLNHR